MAAPDRPAPVTDPRVRTVLADEVLTVTLDAPRTLNAVDAVMLRAVADAVAGAPAAGARVVLLRGEGRAFCSGADLAGTQAYDAVGGATLDAAEQLVHACTSSPLPVVAVVHGPCAGIGVPVALAADLVLCAREAFFQLAFARIGLMPDGGSTALVAAAVGRATALRMALLAERITAPEALQQGLVARVVEAAELDGCVEQVVGVLRSGPAAALGRTKHAVNAATLGALPGAFERERDGQLQLLVAADFREGVAAFGEKRPPVFVDPPLAP